MSIEQFKANFAYGVRPTLYRMEIAGLPEKLQFLCKASQIPGKNIGVIEVPYLNQKAKLAGDVTFDDLTITVIMDYDLSVRNELELWQERIRANNDIIGDEHASYEQVGSLILLNQKKEEVGQWDYVGMWPNSLSPIEMGFESNDQIAEYTVNFSYQYWERVR